MKTKTIGDMMALQGECISCVDTPQGYMQLLEYTLQDCSFVHVLQWHFNDATELVADALVPRVYVETFYRNKDLALQQAHVIGERLLNVI